MESEKPKCEKRIWRRDSFHSAACPNHGKVSRGGKWYCGMHDPVAVQARDDEREAKMKMRPAKGNSTVEP